MAKIPKEVIIQKIKDKAGLSDKEISTRIKDKMDLLAGLISEEGAAYIIANELGVKVYEEPTNLQIKNMMAGLRSVDLNARVVKVYETREFDKNNRKGKVGSFLAGDDTGVIRVTCWNDKADLLQALKEGQIVKIEKAYTKDNNGRVELHLGDKGNITVTGEATGEQRERIPSTRKQISELKGGEDNVEILGTIVQVFEPKFFEVCPECNKRAKENEGVFTCEQHGNVNPSYAYVMNLVIDDGTENIRVVLWRNQVQKILNMTDTEIVSKRGTPFEEQKTELLGRIMKFIGRAQKNEMFQRTEFIANFVITNPDPEEEMKRLQEELDKAKDEPQETEFKEFKEESVEESVKLDDTDEEAEEEEEVKGTIEKINLDKPKEKKEDALDDIDDLGDLENI